MENKNNIFIKTITEQKLITFVFFVLAFSLSTYLLFNLADIFKNSQWERLTINFGYISFIAIAFSIVVRNIVVTMTNRYYSYLWASIIFAYCYAIVFSKVNFEVTIWWEVMKELLWVIPLFSINVFWKLFLAKQEYRVRPFFAHSELLRAIFLTIALIIFGIVFFLVDKHLINGETFNYLDTLTLFLLILAALLLLVIFVLIIRISRYYQFLKVEQSMLKKVYFWTSILHIGPIFVWLISNTTVVVYDNIFIVFVSSCIFILVLFTLISISPQVRGGESKLYNSAFAFAFFAIILLTFFFQNWLNLDLRLITIMTSASLLYLLIINIFVMPQMNRGIIILLNFITWILILFFFIIWSFSGIFGLELSLNNANIPFNLDEIVLLIPLVLATFLLLWNILILFWNLKTNNTQTKQIYKFYVKEKV